jgi:hypothetical protein
MGLTDEELLAKRNKLKSRDIDQMVQIREYGVDLDKTPKLTSRSGHRAKMPPRFLSRHVRETRCRPTLCSTQLVWKQINAG